MARRKDALTLEQIAARPANLSPRFLHLTKMRIKKNNDAIIDPEDVRKPSTLEEYFTWIDGEGRGLM